MKGVLLNLSWRKQVIACAEADGEITLQLGARGAASLLTEQANIKTRSFGFKRKCSLAIAPSLVLERKIADVRLPQNQIRQMAQVDLNTSTPLSAEQVHLLMREEGHTHKASRYVAVKKEKLATILYMLSRAKLKPRSVHTSTPHGSYFAAEATLEELELVPKSKIVTGKLIRLMGFLLLFVCVASLFHIGAKQNKAESLLAQKIEATNLEITKVRRVVLDRRLRMEKIAQIRMDQNARVPIISVIEELAKLIPDSAWVTDITIAEEDIMISGFAQSASSLIGIIDQSAMFTRPALTGRVIRDTNANGERFSISIKLETAKQ